MKNFLLRKHALSATALRAEIMAGRDLRRLVSHGVPRRLGGCREADTNGEFERVLVNCCFGGTSASHELQQKFQGTIGLDLTCEMIRT